MEKDIKNKDGFITTLPIKFQKQLNILIPFLKKYGVTEIYLFGSLYEGTYNDDSDIDIAISGLDPKLYHKVHSIIMCEFEIDCDMIDLDEKDNGFVDFLKKYERWVRIG